MPNVWVIQENPSHDISPAAEFGEIKVLLPFGDANFSVQHRINALKASFLKDYNPDEDYILMTGDPTLIAAVGILADRLAYDHEANMPIRVLKWNRQDRKYLPIMLEF